MRQQSAQVDAFASSTGGLTASGLVTPRGLFDSKWQTGTMPAASASTQSTGLLSRTGMFPKVGTGSLPAATANNANPTTPGNPLPTARGAQPAFLPQGVTQMSPSLKVTTGALTVPNNEQTGQATIKLTGPMKVVQMPVAGQPGQFVTGLLPAQPDLQSPTPPPANVKSAKKLQKIATAVAVILLLVGGTTGVLFMRSHSKQTSSTTTSAGVMGNPNVQATMAAQATALLNRILFFQTRWPRISTIFLFPPAVQKSTCFRTGLIILPTTETAALPHFWKKLFLMGHSAIS